MIHVDLIKITRIIGEVKRGIGRVYLENDGQSRMGLSKKLKASRASEKKKALILSNWEVPVLSGILWLLWWSSLF